MHSMYRPETESRPGYQATLTFCDKSQLPAISCSLSFDFVLIAVVGDVFMPFIQAVILSVIVIGNCANLIFPDFRYYFREGCCYCLKSQ